MKKVMIEGKVVFTGSYEKCIKYCKSMGYMVYNGICWDFKFADIAIV